MTVTPSTPSADPAPWESALADAFRLLLGPVWPDAPGSAAYAVYHADESLDEFLFPAPWCTPEVLADPAPRGLGYQEGEYGFATGGQRFLPGESLFRFDEELLDGTGPWAEGGHKGPRPFGADFAAGVRAVALPDADEVLVRGADLAPLLVRHDVDLTRSGARKLNGWLGVVLRVATDGTLTGAMRAATFTAGGPDELTAPPGGPRTGPAAQPWQDVLAAVPDPALRAHLRLLCLDEDDARSGGAYFCGPGTWAAATDVLAATGCTPVAGWEFGECQAGTVVVRLPGGPHPA